MSLSALYTGTADQKATVSHWLQTEEISSPDCEHELATYTRHRSDRFGGKAGTFGFVFRDDLPPLISSFLEHIFCNITCDRGSGYTISGMGIHWICLSKYKYGFFLDVHAKIWNARRFWATPDEAIKIIFSAYKGIPLSFHEFTTPRERKDGKYAFSSFKGAIASGTSTSVSLGKIEF